MRALCLLGTCLAAAGAPAETFQVEAGKPNRVRFESKAPLETFDGKTDRIRGHITLVPAALADSIDVRLEVDLTSLDTGIEVRNKHMRENHLDTKDHPKAVFTGGTLSGIKQRNLTAGPATFDIEGTMQLHGVSRRLRAACTLTFDATTQRLQARCTFKVALADYQIKRPSFLVMKLDEVQRVELDLVTQPAAKP
jgi:polyisoprenoid-binding protein YceI